MSSVDGYRALAEKVGFPGSALFQQILERTMTEEQARLALLLPASPEELAAKLNISVAAVKELERDLFTKGVIVPKNFQTLEGMRFIPGAVGMHDRMCSDRHMGLELLAIWEEFTETEIHTNFARTLPALQSSFMRVMPAYKAIQNVPGTTQFDDVREIIKAAELVSVVPCSCRTHSGLCRKVVADTCIQIGRSAEYGIVRGTGRKLSKDEAMSIVDLAEDAGLVHQWNNMKTLRGGAMCNCCDCCCVVGRPGVKHNLMEKVFAKTRYLAKVDVDLCDGCSGRQVAACVAQCPEFFRGAIKRHWNEETGTPEDFKAVVDADKCWGCGVCVLKCPNGAISMEIVRPPEHIPDPPPGRS